MPEPNQTVVTLTVDKDCKHSVRFAGTLPGGASVNIYFPKETALGKARSVTMTLVVNN
jgi:hypothetical protein